MTEEQAKVSRMPLEVSLLGDTPFDEDHVLLRKCETLPGVNHQFIAIRKEDLPALVRVLREQFPEEFEQCVSR